MRDHRTKRSAHRALDQPRTGDDLPEHIQQEQDRQTARTKLLALAGDLADLDLRHRLLESATNRRPLLRVWDPTRQALGETIMCMHTFEGWGYAAHPVGKMLSSAEGINEPGQATEAAHRIAAMVKGQRSP